ncbi:SafA/ExsA family spore coat assembly protein [Geomicrobium sp. JCM 19039]|uniref:SafA/ExsA family spore coat assembly protein n=1 Tax=Geomicrobium sp. JCM 19039 TaxID=1460636 RepID=UPI00045F2AF4|nr:SafA/ExsA family spore coat assembly protein [Geomicrobium sp. JCM 19039]GAK11300.1 YrbA protein [Geomicrobium sp. JCM 19039]
MKIHIVQKGDTLWNLAKKYDVGFEELKAANTQLANPDMVMPGMKIKIPGKGVQAKKEVQSKAGPAKDYTKKEQPVAKEQPAQPKKEAPAVKPPPMKKSVMEVPKKEPTAYKQPAKAPAKKQTVPPKMTKPAPKKEKEPVAMKEMPKQKAMPKPEQKQEEVPYYPPVMPQYQQQMAHPCMEPPPYYGATINRYRLI